MISHFLAQYVLMLSYFDSFPISYTSFLGIVNLTIDGQIEPAKPSCLCAHHFLPDLKSLGAQQTVIDRLHEVAAEAKEILCESM